jgi:molybdenum cofactor biosynthesis enzyme
MKFNILKDTNGIVNLQLSQLEVDVLLGLLRFSRQTADFLYQQEVSKGTAVGTAKMQQIMSDSKELIDIISMSIDIGEPPSDEIH